MLCATCDLNVAEERRAVTADMTDTKFRVMKCSVENKNDLDCNRHRSYLACFSTISMDVAFVCIASDRKRTILRAPSMSFKHISV